MAETSRREWALAIGGGLLFATALVWALGDTPDAPESTVELTRNVPPPAAVVPQSAPVQPVIAPPISGYVLRGVMLRQNGGSAIIETADGQQRLVRTGARIAPGVMLAELTAGSAVLAAGANRQTLLLDADRPAPVSAAPVQGLAATANDYRLGMKPVREAGRIIGYEIVDMTRLPVFQKAGLQPGDVVTAISGQGLESTEKLLELPAEIAGSNTVSIDYRRGGAAATASVKVPR